jgi:hypothetical protein
VNCVSATFRSKTDMATFLIITGGFENHLIKNMHSTPYQCTVQSISTVFHPLPTTGLKYSIRNFHGFRFPASDDIPLARPSRYLITRPGLASIMPVLVEITELPRNIISWLVKRSTCPLAAYGNGIGVVHV